MNKSIVIGSSETSRWFSSTTIERNIKLGYMLARGQQFRYLSYDSTCYQNDALLPKGAALVDRIQKLKPNSLVFIADSPHPEPLLRALKTKLHPHPLPDLFIHVYGNFSFEYTKWRKSADILSHYRIAWICASPKQAAFLSQFIIKPNDRVFTVPFPVAHTCYHRDPAAGEAWRKRLGISKNERMLFYSGRLSLQKNTASLIRETADLIERHPNVKLFLAGNFDDIGNHLLDIVCPNGFYFAYWHDVYKSLPKRARSHIHHLGNLQPSQLNGIYNAADLAVSLSLHHDEDFGMAPAEALCAGTPVVLSDWGGYSSFNFGLHEECAFLPVHMHNGMPTLYSNDIQDAFERLLFPRVSQDRRDNLSEIYQSRLSTMQMTDLPAEFKGRRPLMFLGFTKESASFPIPYEKYYRVYR